MTRPTRPSPLTLPQEQTCPKCGWSLLSGGRTEEAHAATCDGLGAAKVRRVDALPKE